MLIFICTNNKNKDRINITLLKNYLDFSVLAINNSILVDSNEEIFHHSSISLTLSCYHVTLLYVTRCITNERRNQGCSSTHE